MNLSFKPLSYGDFYLLLTWLNKAHVQKWWDKGVVWTIEMVKDKYTGYIDSEY